MMKEIWKNTEYEGYMVSNLGRIKHIFKNGRQNILKSSDHGNGYRKVYVGKKGRYVHRLIAQTFIPNPENKEDVNHIDGNRANNNVNNLEWTTRLENMQHAKNILKKDWCMVRKKVQLRSKNMNILFNSIKDADVFLFGKRTRRIDQQIRKKGYYKKNDIIITLF